MPQKSRQKAPVGKKVCCDCHKEKTLTNFYLASNPSTSSDGKTVNVCKACIKSGSLNFDGSINIDKFKEKLMLMDKPYVPSVLDSSMEEVERSIELGKGRTDIIGCYFKNIATLSQYSKLGFLKSINLINSGKSISSAVTTTEKKMRPKEDVYVKQFDNFVVTDDLLDLFGEGYTKNEYRLMSKKFDKLKINYLIQTNLHQEALATYVRFKVKEEQATAIGDVGSADKWNKAAQEAADKAKLTPKQLTQADLQKGVNSFSELSLAIEQATDVISILPKLKNQPHDTADFIIYCYINYARKLKGLPTVPYEDIYKFYDDKVAEYLKQYGDPNGIFSEDTTIKNRPNIEKFITLPTDYDSDDSQEDDEIQGDDL